MLLPLVRGSVRVSGIEVSSTTLDQEVTFEDERLYLGLVAVCEGNVVRLPYGPFALFEVTESTGDIASHVPSEQGLRPFVDEILAAGTLDGLRIRVVRDGTEPH